jgi:membrane-bound lytic murein transglycosylase B
VVARLKRDACKPRKPLALDRLAHPNLDQEVSILFNPMTVSCFAVLLVLSSLDVSLAQAPSEKFNQFVASYNDDRKDISTLYPVEFNQLFQKVQKHVTREELKTILSKKVGIELDDVHMNKVVFIASPDSVSVQRQQHIDWVPKLVNEETLTKGVAFFGRYNETFKSTYEKTGVKPQDIIAILNWESKLGEQRGQYDIFKMFVGQAFYIDGVEKKLYQEGAYNKDGVMSRPEALKRIERIKLRALNNLAELILQSKQVGLDPYTVKGSWAGAIGIPQFMPASMGYAVDGNGDGIIDLNTVEDSILSVANYLQRNGYHSKGPTYAFKRYNQEEMYMRGVALYSEEVQKRGINNSPDWIYKKKT